MPTRACVKPPPESRQAHVGRGHRKRKNQKPCPCARPPVAVGSGMANLSEELAKHIEAANVLVLAGKVEDSPEKLLLVAGREIPNKIAKRIFAGMGPLSTFSGKIEVAYLLN